MEFDVKLEAEAPEARLRVSGRLTAGDPQMRLREVLDSLFGKRFERIAIDLGAVSYLDSAGLGELLRARARAVEDGAVLVVRNPSTQVATLLRLTGLDAVLTGTSQAPGASPAAE